MPRFIPQQNPLLNRIERRFERAVNRNKKAELHSRKFRFWSCCRKSEFFSRAIRIGAEIIKLGAGVDGGDEPLRLAAAARPGIAVGIAVFDHTAVVVLFARGGDGDVVRRKMVRADHDLNAFHNLLLNRSAASIQGTLFFFNLGQFFTNLSSDILFSEKMGKSLVGTNNTKFNLKSNI